MRGRHSFDAVARIRDTTKFLSDVYSEGETLFLHALKVWNRYLDRMFLPYCYQKELGDSTVVEGGVGMRQKDEQMASLVQRVSGSYFGQWFLPCAAGVGYSHSAYQWFPSLPVWYRKSVMERDWEAEAVTRENGSFREIWFANCQALLENKTFTGLMQQILKILEQVYGNPVDIEYTVNMDETGAWELLLQAWGFHCPLATFQTSLWFVKCPTAKRALHLN